MRVLEVITSTAVKNGHGMCAIHTTKADLYTRLWCVHEVAEAESSVVLNGTFPATSPMKLRFRRADVG